MRSKKRARLVSERDLKIDVVTVSQLAPKDVLSPKQRSIRPKARLGITLILCDCRSRRFEGVGKQVVSLRNAYLARAAGSRFVHCSCGRPKERSAPACRSRGRDESYLVDPASSHMLVSKIKPCMSKYKLLYCETANGSLNQLSSI